VQLFTGKGVFFFVFFWRNPVSCRHFRNALKSWGVDQVEMPSKHEALNSNPPTRKDLQIARCIVNRKLCSSEVMEGQ
jgi:hypothetical protein